MKHLKELLEDAPMLLQLHHKHHVSKGNVVIILLLQLILNVLHFKLVVSQVEKDVHQPPLNVLHSMEHKLNVLHF